MTVEEALKMEQQELMIYEHAFPQLKMIIERKKTVIEALEKQIPQKIICYECDPLKSFQKICKACPNCNATLHGEKDFCPECGQALDRAE